jgi:hypothetical protein
MKVRLAVHIECGKHTCASEPGKFCQFAGTIKFGSTYVCRLFPGDGSYTLLKDKDGWLQRTRACMEAERAWHGAMFMKEKANGPG